jgi:hypothetical protein
MNAKNLDYLKDQLKYHGFGEGLNNKLTEQISKQAPQFQIATINEYGKDKVAYTLDFKKGENSDMYFFNKYTAIMKGDAEKEKSQTFFINKGGGVTAKEAYNLLEGRAVNKDLVNAEGQKYNAWLQLDFNQHDKSGNYKFNLIHKAYGYDLEKELMKHPMKELSDPASKEKLLQSLERGNKHQVTIIIGDKEEKVFLEANPRYKSFNMYDVDGKKIFPENKKSYQSTTSSVLVEPRKNSPRKNQGRLP